MTNQTERDAFEKLFEEDSVLEDNAYNRSVTDIIWQAATAYARQDERAKVIPQLNSLFNELEYVNTYGDCTSLFGKSVKRCIDIIETIRALQSKGE